MKLREYVASQPDLEDLTSWEEELLPPMIIAAEQLLLIGVRPKIESLAGDRLELAAWLLAARSLSVGDSTETLGGT